MANSLIDFPLPLNPDPALDPKLAFVLQPILVAVRTLHTGISVATGDWQPTASEFPTISPSMSLISGKHRKIYMVAAVAINAGQLVYINGAGQMALASALALATMARGYATQNVAAGATGEFILFEGLLSVGGAVAGTLYYLTDAAGGIAAAPGTVPQIIGLGVAANLIYVRMEIK